MICKIFGQLGEHDCFCAKADVAVVGKLTTGQPSTQVSDCLRILLQKMKIVSCTFGRPYAALALGSTVELFGTKRRQPCSIMSNDSDHMVSDQMPQSKVVQLNFVDPFFPRLLREFAIGGGSLRRKSAGRPTSGMPKPRYFLHVGKFGRVANIFPTC